MGETAERKRVLFNGHKVAAIRATKQLIQDGKITKDLSREELEVLLMEQFSDTPELMADAGAIDWQTLLDFILKLLPILIAIFG